MSAAKEVKAKNIADQLERNKSEELKCLFRIARQSKKYNKDIIGMPCIPSKDGNIKVSLEDKMEAWKKHEEKLLNEENKWSGELIVEKNEGPCEKVYVKAVVEALAS